MWCNKHTSKIERITELFTDLCSWIRLQCIPSYICSHGSPEDTLRFRYIRRCLRCTSIARSLQCTRNITWSEYIGGVAPPLGAIIITVLVQLLSPTKEDVHVFARVRLSVYLSICLSVCLSVSKITQKTRAWIKCCVSTDVGTWMNWLTFQPDPDHSPDAGTRLLSPIS